VIVPVQAGSKLMLTLQLVPGACENVVVQSPEPDSSWKYGDVLRRPGETAVNC